MTEEVLVPGFGEGVVPDSVDQLTALQVLDSNERRGIESSAA